MNFTNLLLVFLDLGSREHTILEIRMKIWTYCSGAENTRLKSNMLIPVTHFITVDC